MSSPSQYASYTDDSSDAVAFQCHDDSWDAPALTYSGASSPASSASSPSTLPSTPGSVISEAGSPQQQVQGHIPRPRNAFILFRSFFYAQTREGKININQNALSCAAAAAWKELPEDGKKTFRKQAEDEKLMHYKKHPNYVYTPLNRAVKRAQKKTNKPASKGAKRPAKKHRSTLSQRSRKAENLRSTSRRSRSDDSYDSSSGFVVLDDIPHLELAQDEECCDDTKTDGESQKRVDLQFGQRPDVAFTQLPPTPTDATSPADSSPITLSELSSSSDVPAYPNPGYPNWMYNELLGCGTPDAGLHAGWNPLQTTLNSYGDNYFNHDQTIDDLSRYVNYDNVDTTSDDYSSRETTGADAAFSFPSLDYDGNWVGVQ